MMMMIKDMMTNLRKKRFCCRRKRTRIDKQWKGTDLNVFVSVLHRWLVHTVVIPVPIPCTRLSATWESPWGQVDEPLEARISSMLCIPWNPCRRTQRCSPVSIPREPSMCARILWVLIDPRPLSTMLAIYGRECVKIHPSGFQFYLALFWVDYSHIPYMCYGFFKCRIAESAYFTVGISEYSALAMMSLKMSL